MESLWSVWEDPMVVWSEQEAMAPAVTERGHRQRNTALAAIAATLMLLFGLVSPVAAAVPNAPTGGAIPQPPLLEATVSWAAGVGGDAATSFDVTITPPVAGSPFEDASSPLSIPGLARGASYSVSVVAKNADGSSAPLVRTFSTHDVAGPPTGLSAARVGTSASAEVSWVNPVSDGGSPITGFEVSVDGGGWTSAGTASPHTVTGLAVGSHTFRIRTVNGIGESAASNTSNSVDITAPATVPGAPTIGAAARVGTTSSATVAWTAPASNGGAAITDYEVRVDGAGAWTSAGTTSPHTVAGLSVGSHTFEIRAVNSVGPSSASAASNSVVITAPATVPGAPTGVSAARVGVTTSATVSWTAPVSNGGSPITGYQVSVDGGGWTSAGASSPHTVTGLAVGNHTFEIRAVNAVGSGAASSTTNVVNITVAASAPQNVSAVVDANNRVVITWVAPADDGGGVGQYRVSLSPDRAGPTTVGGGTLTTAFSGLASGDYTVSVVAINAGGTGTAGMATFKIVVAPGSPLNVKTSAPSTTTGTATVTWDPPANNGNGTISAYKVSMGGTTQTVAASARSATFTGLPIGKLVATVVAVNAQGDSAAGSSPEFSSNRAVHPFNTREAFARQIWKDLYGVAATPGEATNIAQGTAVDGSNAPAIITNLMRSQRFETRRQISRLYFAYFPLRQPDAAGQDYWADLIDRGVLNIQDVSDEFARSQEFINTYGGLNDAEFLVVVYNNVLYRTPDILGFNYWLGERNKGLTLGGVMTWFSESEEFIVRSLPQVDSSLAYIMLVDRAPTSGEYALWFNLLLDQTASLETLVGVIWTSDEYAARVTPD